jgi:hypothetical protein
MLTENPKRIHERYIARFRQPLDAALKALVAPSASQTSPLMESVKAVCVAAFGTLPHDATARLMIASDMIQYSRILNHYKQRDFEAFAKTPATTRSCPTAIARRSMSCISCAPRTCRCRIAGTSCFGNASSTVRMPC